MIEETNNPAAEAPLPQDGHFRLKVSRDHLYVYLDGLRTPQHGGKPFTNNDVIKALRHAKISHGVNNTRINEIIEGLNRGDLPTPPELPETVPPHSPERLQHLCIAQGDLPQQGKESHLEWLIDEQVLASGEYVVLPAQPLARLTPASHGHEGVDVYGKKVACRNGQDRSPLCGDGVTLKPANEQQLYLSECYGTLQLADNRLSVIPLITVSEDKLEAILTLRSPSMPGTIVQPEHIHSTLTVLGVEFGILQNVIETMVSQFNRPPQGKQPHAVPEQVIARGQAMRKGQDAELRWFVPLENNVPQHCYLKPGEPIARLRLATSGADGTTVYDDPLSATQGISITLGAGAHIQEQEKDGFITWRAGTLGTLQFGEGTLAIDPGLQISEDGMEARLKLRRHSHDHKPVTQEDIATTLVACGISVAVDEALIREALASLPDTGEAADVLVARGTPPQDGKDMRLVLSHKESVGLELAHGRIDFNEHDYPWNVTKGETIGFILPPKVENDGQSVTGKPIKAQPPHALKLELSDIHQNERGKLIADVDGVLIVSGNKLAIAELLVIKGDLNNTVGNVHSKVGVHVKGHVEPGLTLESQKDVVIEKNVENATVKARGSITIKGGIRGKHSEIFTPGTLNVGFMENARVFVNDDINVTKSIINSVVASNGAVFAGSPKVRHAAVMGGELTARTLIEVMELGTPNYAKTIVRLGIPQELRRQLNLENMEIEKLEKELQDLARIEHHYHQHPSFNNKEILQRIDLTRTSLNQQLAEHRQSMEALNIQLDANEASRLVVHKKVFPGVVISINDHHLELSNEYGKGVFTLDDNLIVFHPG